MPVSPAVGVVMSSCLNLGGIHEANSNFSCSDVCDCELHC